MKNPRPSADPKVLIFRAPFRATGPSLGVETPIELLYLTGSLIRAGIGAQWLDGPTQRNPLRALESRVREIKPRLVGISAYTVNIDLAFEAARLIKTIDPGIITALGGIHASALPKEVLVREQALDLAAMGEGERTIVDLASAVLDNKGPEGVKGIAFRRGDDVAVNPPRELIRPLDLLPFLDLGQMDFREYVPYVGNFVTLPSVNMMSCRGCPFHCSYCSTHEIWGNTVRFLSVPRLLAEIENFYSRWEVRDIRFNDDTFPASRTRTVEFCEGILGRGWKINWNCYSRVDTLDMELIRLMKRAGCYHIKFGIEVGTEESLETIEKRATLIEAVDTLREVRKQGITAKASFILGIQNEELSHVRKTVSFAGKLNPEFAIFNVLAFLPGSPDYNRLIHSGRISRDNSWEDCKAINGENARRWTPEKRRAYLVYYLSPRYWLTNGPRLALKFFNTPGKIFRAARIFLEKLFQPRYS